MVKLDKKDFLRPLLTDTYPADVPIIFCNDGLYIISNLARSNSNDVKAMVLSHIYKTVVNPELRFDLNESDRSKLQMQQTTPFKYKIIKNEFSLRTLSLVHPKAQMNYANIYKDYSDLIISLCERSVYSIRSPNKVCNSFYIKSEDQILRSDFDLEQSIEIETIEGEIFKKHSSSYFSYRGYTRIHKLYSSPFFKDLESKFPAMYHLDVANCFDSIYTHTISWAAKSKKYIKNGYVDWSNQFAQKLDRVMQRSNSNETNGIPIGSEFSRVFSEIIFQDIDIAIEKVLLDNHNLINEVDYQILRYVDDYILFGITPEVCDLVSSVISDCLADFNLYINSDKVEKHDRPFCTEKSKKIISIADVLNYFESAIFDAEKFSERKYHPVKIYKRHNFINKFMNGIRLVASTSDKHGYSDISSYLVSFFAKRIQLSVDSYKSYVDSDGSNSVFAEDIEIMIELMFFYYKVNPNIVSSNRIAKTILNLIEFMQADDILIKFTPSIKDLVLRSIKGFNFDKNKEIKRKGYISIERLNIILLTSDFGEQFVLDAGYFHDYIANSKYLNYFEIICLLFYFKDNPKYLNHKNNLLDVIFKKIHSNAKIESDSELCHLVLDLSVCPYIDIDYRVQLLEFFYKISNSHLAIPPSLPTPIELTEYVRVIEGAYWFVNWKNLNIRKLIERNELKNQY